MTGHEYARAQRRAAFVTALEHPDAATRERAQQRVQRWNDVLRNTEAGRVRIGSRAPVEGAPVWATPEVVRGGFATGRLAAEGALADDERATASRYGLPEDRRALFDHALSPAGLANLHALLDDGCYRAEQPEETALLTVAWLHRIGEHLAADRLVAELRPWADRLRFTPRAAAAPVVGLVARQTVPETRKALDTKQERPQIARMRETLAVWNPLRDELVEHWRATVRDGWVGAHRPPEWVEASQALQGRFDELAEHHRLCDKPHRPDDNLAIMLRALHDDAVLPLLAVRLPRMTPRPPERAEQARVAAQPTHPQLAQVVGRRLEGLVGIDDTEALLGPVTSRELPALPDDEPVPAAVARLVRRARRGTVEDLVADGTIPSAEVLAELTPTLTAEAVAADAPDPASRTLLATGLRAFAARRSLLLTGLAAQVRAEELPWIAAVQDRRRPGAVSPSRARLVALGELALANFPATPMPNPLMEQLQVLGRASGAELPLVPELAADIFEGRFSRTFARAASLAGDLLDGTLYARYYGRRHEWTADEFSAACRDRAGDPEWSVAGNGAVIEQAQVLTTHNLIVLAGPLGVRIDWEAAARESLRVVTVHLRDARHAPGRRGALRSVRVAANAWRQLVFHLTAAGPEATATFLASPVDEGVQPLVHALRRVHEGAFLSGTRAPRVAADLGRYPFLGWVAGGPHPAVG